MRLNGALKAALQDSSHEAPSMRQKSAGAQPRTFEEARVWDNHCTCNARMNGVLTNLIFELPWQDFRVKGWYNACFAYGNH